ncbi:MAG: thioredoxin-dependent peroxiredoxin [Actinomycetota bacterium]|jgi:peroxiredoxin Q/BCP|nr:thioredoxin-dependent peroxiredoxin [Actinomycetota bacterium]
MELEKGTAAPDFELPDQDGTIWSLEKLAGKKAVLFFYPADETPGCTQEVCDFRDSYEYWQKDGYVVLGVSPQDAASHKAFIANHELTFPLLVDEDLAVARKYGAVADQDSEWNGIPILVKRSTFVIDENGDIVEAFYGIRAKGHVATLRNTLSV